MKILIVGLGSMGKRRARLTKGIDSSIRIAGVDTAESRRVEATDLGLIDTAYPSIAEAVAAEAPDAALVCTAPLTHAAIISELLDNSLPVFTELNLVADGYEENMAKAKEKAYCCFFLPPCFTGAKLSTSSSRWLHSASRCIIFTILASTCRIGTRGKTTKTFCGQRPHRRRARDFWH